MENPEHIGAANVVRRDIVILNKWVQRLMYTTQTEEIDIIPQGDLESISSQIVSAKAIVEGCTRVIDNHTGD